MRRPIAIALLLWPASSLAGEVPSFRGQVIDPRVGYVRDSFVGMAMILDLLAASGKPLSHLVDELPRYAMVKDQYPLRAGPRGGPEAADRSTGVAVVTGLRNGRILTAHDMKGVGIEPLVDGLICE